MRLMLEIPRSWLEVLTPLTDGDFAIAHQVLEDEFYANFYKAQAASGRLVILDNGFHELGHPLTVPELVRAVDLVHPTVVVAPDRLGDYRFGLEQFEDMRSTIPPEIGLAAVLCGRSPAERAEFFMTVYKHCSMLCLPYKEARFEWFCDLLEKIPNYIQWPPRIHLLGVNEFWELRAFRDKFAELGMANRVSVDTSKPIKFGIRRERFKKSTQLRGVGPLANVQKEAEGGAIADVFYNIAFLRKYV